ncbi:MAG: hypothetical protein IIB22_04800, partial [Chloroflexi bacterium]|nr:hypothetical protein [Chloroflexota bacterium]
MATKSYWDRIRRQRFTRRKMLAVTGASAAGLAIAAACGDSDDDDGPSPTGDTSSGSPRAGGRYIASINGDWGTIDPVTSVGFAPGIFPFIYNVLVDRSRIDP